MKLCKKCNTEKPLAEFHNKTMGKLGKAFHCKTCSAHINSIYRAQNKVLIEAKIRGWHQRNPHKKFEYHAKKYVTIEGRALHLRTGAKKRQPDGFSLTLEHVIAEVRKGYCPVTGIAFDLSINTNGKSSRSWTPFAPSLDKIDPRQSYTDENTRVVIWQYNVMKGELSDLAVLEICRTIVARAV